jgi:hypothetical protein
MPEEVLDDRQKRWLTPLGPAHRIMMRVPLVGVRWTI